MTLRELAEAIGASLIGEAGEAEVLGITGLDSMAPGCIAFVADESRLAAAEAGPALALIAPLTITRSAKPLLQTAHPRLAFAQAVACLSPLPRMSPGVHPSAVLGADVEIGEGAAVGAHCVIGDGVRLGARVQIHPLVSLGAGAQVGEDTVLHPRVTLYDGVRVGARVTIHAGAVLGSAGFGYVFDGERHVHLPHVGTVVVEDDVDIGANVTIDRGTLGATIIGAGSKIDNLVHIAHNVTIGRNCLFAGQVGLSGSVTVGDHVVLGGQVGVADHRTVGNRVGAGGRAAITRDLPDDVIVYGTPARPRDEQLRIDAALGKLPELLKTVRELKKRVEELEGKDRESKVESRK